MSRVYQFPCVLEEKHVKKQTEMKQNNNVVVGLKIFNSRHLKDTVNYWVLISKLLELMGDELTELGKKKHTNVRRTNNFT